LATAPGAAAVAVALGTALAVALVTRVEVFGQSMEPTLLAGDRLLVARLPRPLSPPSRRVVAFVDPRDPLGRRILLKRLVHSGRSGMEVRGDNPAQSTDSRHFGPVERRALVGLAVYRYAPPERAGWIGRPRVVEGG
jgi:nickel-type superoxide dismutase maturation protease